MSATLRGIGLAAVVALFGSTAWGQQPLVQKIDPAQPAGAIVDHKLSTDVVLPKDNDRLIVRWLSVDNKTLIECGQMAADKSTNDAVKQFGKMVADEHRKFGDMFGKGRDETADKAAAANAPHQTAALVRDDGASRNGQVVYRPTDFVAVKEHICDEMRARAKKEMDALSGAEFDRAFLIHMAFGHEAMVVALDALHDEASEQLQPQLTQLREMSIRHGERAKQLRDSAAPHTAAAPQPDGKERK